MSIKIASMNFGDCDTILHNTPNGMKNITEVLGPNGEVYWSSIKELTGIPPLSIRSNGTMLLDYLISGNMSQSGTPTPTTPIQPQECGERTDNLVTSTNFTTSNLYINVSTLKSAVDNDSLFVLSLETDISFVGNSLYLHTDSNNRIVTTLNGTGRVSTTFKLTETDANNIKSSNNPYFYIYKAGADFSSTSVELRSGYKIPISSGGENLFDISKVISNMNVINQGTSLKIITTPSSAGVAAAAPNKLKDYCPDLKVGDTVTLTLETTGQRRLYLNMSGGTWLHNETKTITSEMLDATAIWYASGVSTEAVISKIMFNRGATALPYEPYNRTTTPIYLGEVPTTRRIKKLVLDGTENWTISSAWKKTNTSVFYFPVSGIGGTSENERYILSTHFASKSRNELYQDDIEGIGKTGGNSVTVRVDDTIATTVDGFKDYLRQQYAAGTPVTVWYVLAEPETAVVNEPLRKIGNYADTVSYEQAGVQIPTLHGNTVIDVDTTLKPSQMYIKYK